MDTRLLEHARIEVPLLCGAMYPCSNPELVAAVSEAGAMGIVQPISLTYVHGYDFRAGLRYIRSLTDKPIGMNALIERSSRRYHQRMEQWVDIALEEGVRFFVTSLGNPRWVVDRVHATGGRVYHDVTEYKWAEKGRDAGVDGLIAVNNQAGGHLGNLDAAALHEALSGMGLPLVCAGGIATPRQFAAALAMGYCGVQMGTRFIATRECRASDAYKQAIIQAQEDDIVTTERITGVPVSVIRTPYIERLGTRAGPLGRWMLRGRHSKHLMRTLYALNSLWRLKRSLMQEDKAGDYWQAGKSAGAIHEIRSASVIVREFALALSRLDAGGDIGAP